jgi:cytochrome oxidase Cu insertion factor (SCO1/SenC/PrrC family)
MNFISTRGNFKHNLKPESIILIAMTLALSVACGSDVVDQSHTSNLDDNSSASEKIQPSEQTASPTSNKAPDFSLPSIQGRTFTRSDFEGDKTVLLVFYRAFW